MLLDADPAHAFVPYPAVAVAHAPSGSLAGLTFAVKDVFDVAGYATGGGSPQVLATSAVKADTARAVRRLLDAGARFVGKTHTDEFAFSLNGRNVHFGTPANGAAPERLPGGSSSGSASAVSNGLCDFALGTDTAGSVRAPASHCGLFGLRPTHGRVSLEGTIGLAPSFDTGGYFARDGETFARVGDVLLGRDAEPLPDRPRLLLAAGAFAALDSAVRGALAPVVKGIEDLLGQAKVVEPAPEGVETLARAFRVLQGREAWRQHGPTLERLRPPLAPDVAARFAFGRSVTDEQVAEAEAVRARFRGRFAGFLGQDGVLILPTMPDVAPLLGETEAALEAYRGRALHLLCLAALSGVPQATMPLATRLGAPLGISILGPAGSDQSLVWLADRIANSLA